MSQILDALKIATDIANDDYHGYSQARRLGGRDYDCSSLILYALKKVGINIGYATYTGNMVAPLVANGFINVKASVNVVTGEGLRVGDILVKPKTETRNGHTAFYAGDGKIIQANGDYDGRLGDSSGKELTVQNYYNSGWVYVLRYKTEVAPESYVKYSTHIESIGWTPNCADGAISGTVGKSLRLEAIRIKLVNLVGGIRYVSHLQDTGWGSFVSNGSVSGSEGMARRLEAIRIELTGAVANTHNVLYQVHVQNIGWMSWCKNGEVAGTVGKSLRIEAIRIKITEK